jgi:hypothetical protein
MSPDGTCRVAMSAASPYRFAIVDPHFAQTAILLGQPDSLLTRSPEHFTMFGLRHIFFAADVGITNGEFSSGCGFSQGARSRE